MKNKRFINFRPFLFVALTLIVASVLATYLFVATKAKLVVGLTLLGLSLLAFILCFILKKKALTFLVCLIAIAGCVFMNLYFRASSFDSNLKFNNKEIFISGVICDNVSTTTSGNLAIKLDNVHLLSDEFDVDINGKVVIYTSTGYFDESELSVGRKIEAFGKLNFKSISTNLDAYVGSFSKNEIAGGFISHEDIILTNSYHKTFEFLAKSKVLEILRDSKAKHVEVGYAMLFGDTSFIDSDIKTIFQTTGIAHLLAVSGLHVSVIVSFVGWILAKLKASKGLRFALISALLAVYSYICGYSVSVVRATLMAIILLYANLRGKPYDKLSVLSLVASLLLLLNPLYLFNYSFILSFVAVLSIFMLSKPIERLLDKVFYKKLSGLISLNFAVQIGLFAFSIFLFGKFEVLGILCNLISVPIASIAFVFLIVSTLIVSIMPFMSFLLSGYGFLVDIVIKFNYAVSRLGWTLRFGELSILILVFSLMLMFILSDYVFVSRKSKLALAAVPASLMLLFVFI